MLVWWVRLSMAFEPVSEFRENMTKFNARAAHKIGQALDVDDLWIQVEMSSSSVKQSECCRTSYNHLLAVPDRLPANLWRIWPNSLKVERLVR